MDKGLQKRQFSSNQDGKGRLESNKMTAASNLGNRTDPQRGNSQELKY